MVGRSSQVQTRAGFTLLEVMIAVVILAVGLSSLFTSEGGAIRIAQRARTTTVATLLARCKMGEIEEKIAKEGWPATAMDERDECCEDAEHEGYTCEWKIDRIVLPESVDMGEDASESALEKLKAGSETDPNAPTPPGGPQTPPATPEQPDPLQNMGIPLTGLGGLTGGTDAEGTGGGVDPISSLVMEFAFPVMKPIIEEQVRRATVRVVWKEGSSEQSFEVVQFLVNELPMLAPEEDEEKDPNPNPPPAPDPRPK
jgi:general secretion pathway protein I